MFSKAIFLPSIGLVQCSMARARTIPMARINYPSARQVLVHGAPYTPDIFVVGASVLSHFADRSQLVS